MLFKFIWLFIMQECSLFRYFSTIVEIVSCLFQTALGVAIFLMNCRDDKFVTGLSSWWCGLEPVNSILQHSSWSIPKQTGRISHSPFLSENHPSLFGCMAQNCRQDLFFNNEYLKVGFILNKIPFVGEKQFYGGFLIQKNFTPRGFFVPNISP